MIGSIITQLLAGAGLGLVEGGNLFAGNGVGTQYVVVINNGREAVLSQTRTLRRANIQLLLVGYGYETGAVFSENLENAMSGFTGSTGSVVIDDSTFQYEIKSVSDGGYFEYINPKTEKYEFSINFMVYCTVTNS
jgi:hypothetical protein